MAHGGPFLSAAEGQRPRNYLSGCSWIFVYFFILFFHYFYIIFYFYPCITISICQYLSYSISGDPVAGIGLVKKEVVSGMTQYRKVISSYSNSK